MLLLAGATVSLIGAIIYMAVNPLYGRYYTLFTAWFTPYLVDINPTQPVKPDATTAVAVEKQWNSGLWMLSISPFHHFKCQRSLTGSKVYCKSCKLLQNLSKIFVQLNFFKKSFNWNYEKIFHQFHINLHHGSLGFVIITNNFSTP